MEQPDLNTLMALIAKRKEKQDALEQLAATQTHQDTVFDSREGLPGKMAGFGASPRESRVMLEMLSSRPQRGERRIDAWSRGLGKGLDLRDEVSSRRKAEQMDAAKIGLEGATQDYALAKDVRGLGIADEQTAYDRSQDAVSRSDDLKRKGVVSFGGNVHQTDSYGNILGKLGETEGSLTRQTQLQIAAQKGDPNARKALQARHTKLSEESTNRRENITKATKFLDAFTSGAESGTSRAAAKWLPGVFTDQGAFDQELDSFAEEAARAALKAAGEIRPTDADVKGMKEALFGVGKDEAVNINLLQSYINKQMAMENEQRELEGLEPAPLPQGVDQGDEWYEQLFSNTASGAATNQNAAPASAPKVIKW